MLTNKTKLIGLVAIIALIGLICSSVIAFVSIDNAKKENEVAREKLAELGGAINSLEETLKETNEDISEHENLINKYQEIFNAWSKATPEVKGAIDEIMATYGDATENAHLFPTEVLDELEDEMMNAIYGAIRSTDPAAVAKDFEDFVLKASESRYDVVLRGMLNKIKENGVTFPEDVEGVKSVRAYFDGFSSNPAVIKSFAEQNLDKELAEIEALLDSDEENDLAKKFEEAVAQIKTPITLETSLKDANSAWDALYAVLEGEDILNDDTIRARVLLDTYFARVNELTRARAAADVINARVESFKPCADLLTRNFIDDIEKEIAAWVKEFNVDQANMHLVCDLAPTKSAYEGEIAKLRALYEEYKRAIESIGEVNINSKASINYAYSTYEALLNYSDVRELLGLKSPYTVGELYEVLKKAINEYTYLVSLIDTIRAQIDEMLNNELGVTQNDVDALNGMVNELLSLGASLKVINTEKTDYISRLDEARLIPSKNAAQEQINGKYEDYYGRANEKDLLNTLTKIKDEALYLIKNAKSVDELLAFVERAFNEFAKCFS